MSSVKVNICNGVEHNCWVSELEFGLGMGLGLEHNGDVGVFGRWAELVHINGSRPSFGGALALVACHRCRLLAAGRMERECVNEKRSCKR